MLAAVVFVFCVTPTAAVTVISLSFVILSTILVTVSFSSSWNTIWSPIFNSVVNLVPLPTKVFCGWLSNIRFELPKVSSKTKLLPTSVSAAEASNNISSTSLDNVPDITLLSP